MMDNGQSALTPVFPELSTDLDLKALTATDTATRWEVIIAGTHATLDRLDELATWTNGWNTDRAMIDKLRDSGQRLAKSGAGDLADSLAAVERLLVECGRIRETYADGIRRASTYVDITWTITAAIRSLDCSASNIAEHTFDDLPDYRNQHGSLIVQAVVGETLAAELNRLPLQKQLGGVGGLAGDELYNPFVAALARQHLAARATMYRRLRELSAHVGLTGSARPNPHREVDAHEL